MAMLAAVALLALASPSAAQAVREPFPTWNPSGLEPSPGASRAAAPPGWRLAAGGTLAALGTAGLAVALTETCSDDPGDDGCEWAVLSAGAVAAAFAVPGGVQLAGSRRSYGRLLLGSVGGMLAGWLVAEAMHAAGANGEELLVMIPIVQIGATTILGR